MLSNEQCCVRCDKNYTKDNFVSYTGGPCSVCERCRKRRRNKKNRQRQRRGEITCHHCESQEDLKHDERICQSFCSQCVNEGVPKKYLKK
jgi:hypothetical protein